MATGAQIITKFQNMVDDVLDTDFAYQLLNDAKDEVEAMQDWEQLKNEQAYSVSSGYSFTSALGALPTRFSLDVVMNENGSYVDYEKVSFEDRYGKANHPLGYFIDLSGGNIHLTGSNHSAKTMYLCYTKYSADITSSTSWAFPSRFHGILALKMAELYFAADAGERGRSWDDKWAIQFERELGRMTLWDDMLKTRNRTPLRKTTYNNPKSVGF
jgi:hypothetical protein